VGISSLFARPTLTLCACRFFKPHPAATDFATLNGVRKMSNKYQVDNLRKRALLHLGSPPALSSSRPSVLNPQTWKVNKKDLPFLIALCHEVGALWVLPLAFFHYSQQYSASEIILGQSMLLSATDQATALAGSIHFHTQAASELLKFLLAPTDIPGCTSRVECLTRRMDCRRLAESRRGSARSVDGLFSNQHLKELRVCKTCLSVLVTELRTAYAEFHDNLPGLYNLPDWDTLNALKAAALE
jgi:hypothetical protein